MGFIERAGSRALSFVFLILLAGLTTNWRALAEYKVLGGKQLFFNLIFDGITNTFAGIPTGVSTLLQGGAGLIVGLLMLFFPILAWFIIVDFVLDIATGLETEPWHVTSFIIALFIVILMGVARIGWSNAWDIYRGGAVVNASNVSNASGVVNSTVQNASGNPGGVVHLT